MTCTCFFFKWLTFTLYRYEQRKVLRAHITPHTNFVERKECGKLFFLKKTIHVTNTREACCPPTIAIDSLNFIEDANSCGAWKGAVSNSNSFPL